MRKLHTFQTNWLKRFTWLFGYVFDFWLTISMNGHHFDWHKLYIKATRMLLLEVYFLNTSALYNLLFQRIHTYIWRGKHTLQLRKLSYFIYFYDLWLWSIKCSFSKIIHLAFKRRLKLYIKIRHNFFSD